MGRHPNLFWNCFSRLSSAKSRERVTVKEFGLAERGVCRSDGLRFTSHLKRQDKRFLA
jgi:hypothetical protein